MNDLNTQIAERLGWKFHGANKSGLGCCPRRPGDMNYAGTMPRPLVEQWTPPAGYSEPGTPLPPDFAGDLNACAELRKGLTAQQKRVYAQALQSVASDAAPEGRSVGYWWIVANATAEDHCHAYLHATQDLAATEPEAGK